ERHSYLAEISEIGGSPSEESLLRLVSRGEPELQRRIFLVEGQENHPPPEASFHASRRIG
ncbi:MAG: hypothetical protein RBU30_02375, partial [Polyangia bacterium]|nr:hypothetical protein [Polyangia bacterium]